MAGARSITIFAPAKVNLFLHVTGRRADGYHHLDSLVTFADVGDRVRFDPAPSFSFALEGPLSDAFVATEREEGPHSTNLAVRAVWALAHKTGRTPAFRLTLTKNLPLGAGLGGGSADAAAVLWGLMDLWNVPAHAPFLPELMTSLGADVPVCVGARSAMVRGIGEQVDPAPPLPEMPVVLVWPGRASNTAQAFRTFADSGTPFSPPIRLPDTLEDFDTLIAYLAQTRNDLLVPASVQAPEISGILDALRARQGCVLARMSGAGSACFGLFAREEDSVAAALTLAREYPRAWVRAGWLGRIARY